MRRCLNDSIEQKKIEGVTLAKDMRHRISKEGNLLHNNPELKKNLKEGDAAQLSTAESMNFNDTHEEQNSVGLFQALSSKMSSGVKWTTNKMDD